MGLHALFETTKVAELDKSPSKSALPAGKHQSRIGFTDLKDTKAGDKMLVIRFDAESGEGSHWQNYNVGHSKEDVAVRAKAEVASLCQALGLDEIPDDAGAFVLKRLVIDIGQRQTKDSIAACRVDPMTEKEFESVLKGYLPTEDSAPPKLQAVDNNSTSLPKFS